MANNTLGMTDKAFEQMIDACKDDIWSFSGSNPPKNATYVGKLVKKYGTYVYYTDSEGKLIYNTEEDMEFSRQMQESEKRLKKAKEEQRRIEKEKEAKSKPKRKK